MSKVKNLLLTRPSAQSRVFSSRIAEMFPNRINCVISPLIEIVFEGTCPVPDKFQAVVFTSANAVRAFVRAHPDATPLAFCVGANTAKTAMDAGLKIHCANGGVTNLVAAICENLSPDAAPLLYVRGIHTAADLSGMLAARGFGVKEAVLYRQNAVPLNKIANDAIAQGQIDAIPLFSPRTAQLLMAEFDSHPAWPRQNPVPLCISANVANVFINAGFVQAKVAKAPTRDEMLALIGAFLG